MCRRDHQEPGAGLKAGIPPDEDRAAGVYVNEVDSEQIPSLNWGKTTTADKKRGEWM